VSRFRIAFQAFKGQAVINNSQVKEKGKKEKQNIFLKTLV
jgi:hypothetical protein